MSGAEGEGKGRERGEEGRERMEGASEGLVKSVKRRARKVASPPLRTYILL